MRRITSSLILALLFSSLCVFALTVRPGRAASEIIVINSDGSISSLVPANITTSDNVTYTFSGNNYLPIVVNRSNIIINGNACSLQASGENGFSLTQMSKVTIKNTVITDSWYGIFLNSSSDNVLSGNNVANSQDGVYLEGSSNDTVSGNDATADYFGIKLDFSSSNNTISGNDVTANNAAGIEIDRSSNDIVTENNVTENKMFGIDIRSSSGNVLSHNVIENNEYNLCVLGSALSDYMNSADTSNLVNGKPVYYITSKSNMMISPKDHPDVGCLAIVNCANVTVQGLTLTNEEAGIMLAFTKDSKITDNNVTNDNDGIYLEYSSNNTVSGNTATANGEYGICFEWSSNNVVSDNDVTANGSGIYLLSSSSNNAIYHNNFINNTSQAGLLGWSSVNSWDDGYPSGGNYWSDYTGVDLKNGLGQNQTGSDGIGDAPYGINTNNKDRYPLMGKFNTYPVPSPGSQFNNVTVISNSTITGFLAPLSLETLKAVFISFNVTGKQGSTGFCRVSIPTAITNGAYHVLVNGTEIPYTLLPCSNANVSYLYFTYRHSTERVIILPEFPSFLILPLLIMTTLLGAALFKKKRNVKK